MPIHPENSHRYPPDWREVSVAIKTRAGWQCECVGECGLHPGKRCEELHGEPAKWAKGKIILTVAHLDHTPENCDDENLKAMCQRCHLRYDTDHHRESGARRKREKAEAAGQLVIAKESE